MKPNKTAKKKQAISNAQKNVGLSDFINDQYKSRPGYGVQFSIEPEAYQCRLGKRVAFGEGVTEMQGGIRLNYQDILLDGKTIGWLEESQSSNFLHPICTSFNVWLADWKDEHTLTDTMRNNPHFYDGCEYYCMRFATLNQLLDYLGL